MQVDSITFARFVSRVRFTEGCWLWEASTQNQGYGRFAINKTPFLAHRFSYEVMVGPIPDGLQIDHLCRTRTCVRPDHLEAVTAQENTRRALPYKPQVVRLTRFCKRCTATLPVGKKWRLCETCKSLPRTMPANCPQGHAMSLDNVAVYGGTPTCRTCKRERRRLYLQRTSA